MTDSTAAALEGIGLNSKKIQKELQSGSITTFEVMQLVSDKLNELPESSAAVGTAIADIFGGPGEDAGLKYIRTLKDISTNLDEVKAKAGELGRVEEDLINSQTELTKEIALLFDATGGSFEKMTTKIKLFVNSVLSELIKEVRGLFDTVETISNREEAIAKRLGETIGTDMAKKKYIDIEKARKEYIKQGISDNEALEKAKQDQLKILELSLAQEEEYFQKTIDINEKYNKELKDASIIRQGLGLDRTNKEINQDISKSWKERMNQLSVVESLRKQINDITNYEPTSKATGGITSAANIEAKKKEIAELRKAEDEALKLIKDSRKRQTEEIELQYSRQIEDLKKRIKTEEDLTPKAKEAINKQITSLEAQKQQALKKLSDEELQKEIANRQKLIEIQLESVKKGSEQEYQLKMQQLIAQRDLDLSNTELTEQMKFAIREKYNKKIDDLVKQHDADLLKKQQDAMKLRYETEIAKVYNDEAEVYRIRLKQRKEELDAIQQMEGESIEAFNLRKLELKNAYLDAEKELADKEVEIETQKSEAIGNLIGGISSLLELAGETNEEMARAAKLLAIAEVAIAQGVAIANAVKTATSSSATWIDMLAAIGTVVGAVTAMMGTAMKSIKSAKFATGGLVTGPGTGTSDSIPAQLSNGESVMTARTTELFAPILSSFNQMGGGVPINITASSNQTMGEDMLARAVAKGVQMMPNPVVSVTEINTVGKRVEVLENLESL